MNPLFVKEHKKNAVLNGFLGISRKEHFILFSIKGFLLSIPPDFLSKKGLNLSSCRSKRTFEKALALEDVREREELVLIKDKATKEILVAS